jgi:hypothetical protein
MKHLLIRLIDELTRIINSGALPPETETKFINLKNQVVMALKTYELLKDAQLTILILEVIKLIGDFFMGK